MVGSLVALCLVYYMLAIACVIVKGRHYLIRHASPQPRHRLCVPFEAPRFRTELEMEDRHEGGQETTLGLAVAAHLYHDLCSQLSQLLGVASDLEPCQTPPPSVSTCLHRRLYYYALRGYGCPMLPFGLHPCPQFSTLLVASGSAPDT